MSWPGCFRAGGRSLLRALLRLRRRRLLALLIGIIAGYAGGLIETVFMRAMDAVLSFRSCCSRSCSSQRLAPGRQPHHRYCTGASAGVSLASCVP